MKNEFLNKSVSLTLSNERGFDIEARVLIDGSTTQVALKSFKEGYPIFYSMAFWNHTLEKALKSTANYLEEEISRSSVYIINNDNYAHDFVQKQIFYKSMFEGCGKFELMSRAEQDTLTFMAIDSAERKEDILRFIDKHYFMLVNSMS